VAAIGDSACQVFPAHGSGVGAGMVAARYLAETVIADRPLHDYAVRWQREKGGLFASYDLLRRASERLSVEDLEQMMTSGLLNAELARAGMEQRLPSMHPAQAAVLAIGAATRPLLAARLGAALPKLLAARALYRRYPQSPFELTTWSRRIAAIFGDAPDLG